MAYTTTTNLNVNKQSAMFVPAMSVQPLRKALENLNYLHRFHQPPLVDVCPNITTALGRVFVWPILPSVDALRYTLETRVMPSNTSTCTIDVHYTTGYAGVAGSVWVLLSSTTTATVAATLLTKTVTNITIPADAVALKYDISAAAGTVFAHHLLVYPSPNAPTAGALKPSGFIPFDDGMLTAAGAPIHTELLNRCKASTLAILRDRYQQCLSFAQTATGAVHTSLTGTTTFVGLPPMRVWFPFQGPHVTIKLHVIADVSAGATADQVQVRQTGVSGANSVTFNAVTDTTATGILQLALQGEGLRRYADLQISGKTAAVGNTLSIRAVAGYWRPTEVS